MNVSKSYFTPSASRRVYNTNTSNHLNEFNLIKSHEKEALFLSERFGDRQLDSTGGRNLAGTTLAVASTYPQRDPGFAPEVLHLSKGKIDQSMRLGSK